MVPSRALVERFTRDLDALVASEARIGVAVSGGADSLALLLLAAAARPGVVEAATVDHALRPDSGKEADMVAKVSSTLGIPHASLAAEWRQPPVAAIQERARAERYRLLSRWASERQLEAVLTAHHSDDQAETLLMRLARGSGVRGLSSMRPHSNLPGSRTGLLRPLLCWTHSELEGICAAAGLEPVDDPSNRDEQFERVRVRRALKENGWLSPTSIALSAANLREAEAALEWAAREEWKLRVKNGGGEICYRPEGAPGEIRRRIVSRAVSQLATEAPEAPLRGRELERLLILLDEGGQGTLRGVCCVGGEAWRFYKAPPRNR